MTVLIIEAVVTFAVSVSLVCGVTLRRVALVIAGSAAIVMAVCGGLGTFEFGPHIEIEGWKVGGTLAWYLIRDFLMGAGLAYITSRLNEHSA